MLGWFYYTVKIRLGREVKRAVRCSIWFSDSFLRHLRMHTHTHSQTRDLGVNCRGCCSCYSLRDHGQTGYWSDGLLSELKMFIMLSAFSAGPLSLMDHSTVLPCTCPCHPHTLTTIDPHVTRPCPAGASLGGGMFLLYCQCWNMFRPADESLLCPLT